jgi:hypothetical protein
MITAPVTTFRPGFPFRISVPDFRPGFTTRIFDPSIATFELPQTALVAALDTYNFNFNFCFTDKKSRVPRSAETLQERMRSGRVLPEHIDLGLRLTVGKDDIKKPFLQSSHGDGHFPEMSAQTEPSPNAYFPSLNAAGYPGNSNLPSLSLN